MLPTPIIIAAIAVVVMYLIWRLVGKSLAQEREKREQEISVLAYEVRDLLDAIPTLDTTPARVTQCGKALRLLKQAETYRECRDVITNFDQLKERLEKLKLVFPVIDHVRAANNHKLRNNPKAELAAMVKAMRQIRAKNITDRDFLIADDHTKDADRVLTVASIENRLAGMGWHPSYLDDDDGDVEDEEY